MKGIIDMKNLRDKKIVICKKILISATGDKPNFELKPIHEGKLWAYIRQLSMQEVSLFQGKLTSDSETMIFEMNWRDDVTMGDVIQYENRVYGIDRIDTYEGYKDTLKITATATVRK